MTPRGTDSSLAALVAALFTTGLLSLVSGRTSDAWVFTLHGLGGFALAFVTTVKLLRVWPRLAPRRLDRRSVAGIFATVLVMVTLVSGWVWSSGGDLYYAGFNLLNWHIVFGFVLTAAVLWHALIRAKAPRKHDLMQRRQFLHLGSIAIGATAASVLQRPTASAAGWRGASRRWTGSYERGSYMGNAFPATSWVADRPRPLMANAYRLHVNGLVAQPLDLALADLHLQSTITATLDCTGGFFSTQHWHGVPLRTILDQAGVDPAATHVRVISHTGYRWSFPLDDTASLLLASRVGDEALSHEHGAPLRLVAPGRRGFQWIKWVVRLQVHTGPDLGASGSTVWSSWTPEGRGDV
jgi:DMSO/TMAO reductase YedYZ molybdopterin-dependent catalytic subunit